MNKLGKIGSLSVGGAALFVGSFIIFAALSGVPLHDVGILKSFVPDPQDGQPTVAGPGEGDPVQSRKTDAEVVEASLGVLNSFVIESPFSTEELAALQRELKSKLRDLDQREVELLERGRLVREREDSLEARWEELMNLRSVLDEFESELHARGQELARDEAAHIERERTSWKKLAKAFEEGEAGELIPRLLQYPPEDAARILHALEDERASELLRAFSPESSFEYWEAYRKHRDSDL